jgi:hypothetical protein
MVARLNDLPAAPAFEDAASALTPGGVSWPPYGVQKLPVAAGVPTRGRFVLSALIGGALAGIAEIEAGSAAQHPAAFPGLHTVYKNSRSPAGVPARGGFVLSALIGRALAQIAEIEAGGAAQHPTTFPGLHTVRKNCRSPAGASTQSCFVFSALIGGGLAGIAEIGAGRAARIRSPFRASIRSARIRGRRRARRRHLVFVFSALIGERLRQLRKVAQSAGRREQWWGLIGDQSFSHQHFAAPLKSRNARPARRRLRRWP